MKKDFLIKMINMSNGEALRLEKAEDRMEFQALILVAAEEPPKCGDCGGDCTGNCPGNCLHCANDYPCNDYSCGMVSGDCSPMLPGNCPKDW